MKNQFRHTLWIRMMVFILVPMFFVRPVVLRAQIMPGGVLDSMIDREGHGYHYLSLAVNDTVRYNFDSSVSMVTNVVPTCTSGYFQMYLEPGCGMENDADATHLARRAVFCKVLEHLSSFIHSPLSTTGSKVNIWVRDPAHLSGMGGQGYATSFFNIPSSTTASGIADNTAWSTIHSGHDVFPEYWPFAQSMFHVVSAFDFTYSFHTDLTSSPSSSEYDLYTVILREMLHALGLSSEIASDGSSLLGGTHNYYSRYDQFLTTHSGISLLQHTGATPMSGYSFNSALVASSVLSPNPSSCIADSTSCDTSIQYNGSISLPVYTPNCYEIGLSLSCPEDQCYSSYTNNNYFVASNLTGTGSMKRSLTPEERIIMGDIGYTIDTTYGDTATSNFQGYGGGILTGNEVAGMADGFDSSWNIVFFGDSTHTVSINGGMILSNDINADAF